LAEVPFDIMTINDTQTKSYETSQLEKADHRRTSNTGHDHLADSREEAAEYEFDPVLVRRVKRKVDWRLTPVLALMYIINQIDRSNLGNA